MMEAPPAWTQAQPSAEQQEAELFSPYSTLDEPVRETIMRDVSAVVSKLKVVLLPLDYKLNLNYNQVASEENEELSENDKKIIQQLKDWDLWGPLVLCLGLAVVLSFKAPTDQASLVFAAVFCAFWLGGTVVTLNAQLLGGTLSFFQSLCVLGYCIFPLTMAALVIAVLKIVFEWWVLDLILVGASMIWATRASSVFLSLYVQPTRRFLALYPLFFFYTFFGWMICTF